MKAGSRLVLVPVVLGLAACGGGDATAPTVAAVVVTPASVTLSVGATQQYAAQALGSDGRVVTGEPVAWRSSNEAVATVGPSGLATAVAAGAAEITATIAGVAGSGALDVNAPSPACEHPTAVVLSPGQWQAFPVSTCLMLPSGSSGDRYRVAVTRPTEAENAADVTTVTLDVTGLGVAAASSAAARAAPAPSASLEPITGLSVAALAKSVAVADATERFEAQLREEEAALLRRMRRTDLLPRGRGAPPVERAAAVAAVPPQRAVAVEELPAKLTFQPATPSDCKTGVSTVTGILVHQNEDMAIYQDSAQRVTKPISEAQATRMTDYFSAYARDMVRSYFGENPDVDGNGKEIVFASPVVAGNIAAWVWSGNYFEKESCPASNERDMIYFNTDLIRAMDDATPNWQALETVSHEAKHVVSLYNRIAAGMRTLDSRPYQPLWIEEGTAEVSGEMSSRVAWAANGGPAVGARVARGDFVKSGITPENYGVLVRMARTVWYLSSQPNGLIVAPAGAASGSDVYASGWNFERWLGDAYGAAANAMADTAIFHAMTDSLADKGTAGLQQRTGKTFYDLFDEFVVAVCLEGTGAPRPGRAFTSYDFTTATNVFQNQPPGAYPWPVTTTGAGASAEVTKGFQSGTYAGPIGATGIRIHDFVSNGTGTGAQVAVSMEPPGRILVVRIR